MSHNIEYFEYPYGISRDKVKKELDAYVAHADWQEGCSGLNNPIRWINGKTYDTYEEAEAAIKRYDNGWYDNVAVPYYRTGEMQADAKYNELSKKSDDLRKEFDQRMAKLYPATLTSDFIGCKNCGSRLSRKHLHTNFCPVCEKDLRPEYMLKSIEAARSRMNKATDAAAEYLRKKAKKEVWWLVKIEYHT